MSDDSRIEKASTPISRKCKSLGLSRSTGKKNCNHNLVKNIQENRETPQKFGSSNLNLEAFLSTPKYKSRIVPKINKSRLSLTRKFPNQVNDDKQLESNIKATQVEISDGKEIINEIDSLKTKIEEMNAHKKKVDQLKDVIDIWNNAFKESFNDLKQKSELMENEDEKILQMLGLSIDLVSKI